MWVRQSAPGSKAYRLRPGKPPGALSCHQPHDVASDAGPQSTQGGDVPPASGTARCGDQAQVTVTSATSFAPSSISKP